MTSHLIGLMNPGALNSPNGRRAAPKGSRTVSEPVKLPPFTRLSEFLTTPDEPAIYRIDQLWPVGGRVVLAAQYKAGKSTLVANLLRALVDGDPFLGEYRVTPVTGSVALIDDELDERTLRRWLREQGIGNVERVAVLPLRGKVGTFDIFSDTGRTGWVTELRSVGTEVLLLDCLRPILDAHGLDEHKDAGRFLVPFDALLAEAGIGEALVSHHTGHAGERSRGDSRIRDWPDVEWRIVRTGDEPSSPRLFTAYGRDVDVPRQSLRYDQARRHLRATPEPPDAPDGTDLPPAARKLLEAVKALREPSTITQLVDWVAGRYGHGLKRPTASTNLNLLLDRGLVDCLTQPGRESLWSPVTVSADTLADTDR
jgi:AAA domain